MTFFWGASGFISLPSSAILSHLSTQHPASPQPGTVERFASQLWNRKDPIWIGLFKKVPAPIISLPLAHVPVLDVCAPVALQARLLVPAHTMNVCAFKRSDQHWSCSVPLATFNKPTLPSSYPREALGLQQNSGNHGPLNNQRPDVPRTARWEMEQIYSRRFFSMPGVCHVVSSAFCIADYVVMTLVLLPTDILEQNSERNSQCCTTGTQNIPPGYEGGREVWAMSSPEANVARVWLSCGCTAVVFASCFGAL